MELSASGVAAIASQLKIHLCLLIREISWIAEIRNG
jgi:hypothetical protein